MLNVNAAMIMITCFLFAYLSGKMRATTSMTVGTLFACVAFVLIGASPSVFLVLGAIATFSVGEMLSSPKFNEFIGNFAPADKKAMYLGFSQLPLAVGKTLEGKVGPVLYDRFASKDAYSREALGRAGMSQAEIAQIPQGEAFSRLVSATGQTKEALTHGLYASHSVGTVWYIMSVVGVGAALAITLYGRFLAGTARRRASI
jgi:hypothetical protein